MDWLTDRVSFAIAVTLYGVSAIYSIFVLRRGFREDNRLNYFLLLAGFGFHTAAMVKRGFSLDRCPINNLYEATTFIVWTIIVAYLVVGTWWRLRVVGAFASPVLFGLGVFALMPALDVHAAQPTFTGGLASLHKALILLAFGTFGLASVSAVMYLTQEHDLKFHKLRAMTSLMPPIRRLESVTMGLVLAGFLLLTGGLLVSAAYLRQTGRPVFSADPVVLYCGVTWLLYFILLLARWRFAQRGRRLAWGAIASFVFVMLSFWGAYLLSGLHQRPVSGAAGAVTATQVAFP